MKILKRLVFLFLAAILISANILSLRITNERLIHFDSLLEQLSDDNIVELDFSSNIMINDQLACILKKLGSRKKN